MVFDVTKSIKVANVKQGAAGLLPGEKDRAVLRSVCCEFNLSWFIDNFFNLVTEDAATVVEILSRLMSLPRMLEFLGFCPVFVYVAQNSR